MFHIDHIETTDNDAYYESLLLSARGLMDGERNLIANLANIASLLYFTMSEINWAGFYLMRNGELVLGPFHGRPACIRIGVGKGVCGTAAETKEVQLVRDVHEFPGHIACDGDTNSEIVLPIIIDGQVLGVLDIDSPLAERFDEVDKKNLELLVLDIISGCDWEGLI